MIKPWQEIKIQKDGKIIKKYKFCGITLLRKEKSPTKKKWNFLGVKVCKKIKRSIDAVANFSFKKKKLSYKNIKEHIISIEKIKDIILQPNIKVVSFDIFDTLLIRPVLQPTDIFYLIAAKLKKKNNIDFIAYRLSAEQKLNNPYASMDDIYDFIKKEYNLSSDIVDVMKEEELACEEALLSRRDDVFALYEFAIKSGKRVIATSDMYLSKLFLQCILNKNGYSKIAKIYVSNECKCRKDTGELYKYVAQKEKTKPQNILHIGDNYDSDYIKAIEKNVTAIYYPSIKDIIFAKNSIYQRVWPVLSPDPMMRILLGYTLNNYFKNMEKVKNTPKVSADFDTLLKICIDPVIFYIALSIANNKEIQNNYKKVFFASRDGYLPKLAYDIIAKYHKILPSEYLYAGRRAYFSCFENSFEDYIKSLQVDTSHVYTIIDLLEAIIHDDKLKNKIIKSLSKPEKNLDFTKDNKQILEILKRYSDDFEKYFIQHRLNAEKYYNTAKTDNQREIVFDCGYSGSISKALTTVMQKPVDKIYLWETAKNKLLDLQNGTKTIILMNENYLFSRMYVLYEELFSPLQGGCLGFNNQKPIIEKCDFSEKMRNKYNLIKAEIELYMTQICQIFKNYLPYISMYDTCALQKALYYSIKESPFQEVNNLNDICFPDPIFTSKAQTLSYKIQETLGYDDVYQHTGFDNPLNVIKPQMTLPHQSFKIGIHCHLYNTYLYQEILDYLQDFPVKFDFILTICDKQKKEILENIFNTKTIPNLEKLIIKIVPNRGRDVAPWLVTTAEMQSNYDLFCHIHGKVSKHFDWGNDWRRYLLDNLIKKDAVIDILNLFAQNANLGLVFPKTYSKLRELCSNGNIAKEGVDNEIIIIQDLLQRMHLNSDFTRKDLFFSEGTMMWYRPQALKPLFELKLKYTDFPEEPIGVGGTIAHAIERLPACVCKQSGYNAKFFTKFKN